MTTTINQKQMLMSALSGFLRWEREGKPKYWDAQYYYDDYHNYIERVEPDVYRFSIQTYDSPMGDTWWCGTFKTLNGGVDVELLMTESRHT